MQLETQFKFSRNPQLKYFIRENSYWYKYLNRDSNRFDEFVEEMKITYKLTTTDKINNTPSISYKGDFIKYIYYIIYNYKLNNIYLEKLTGKVFKEKTDLTTDSANSW